MDARTIYAVLSEMVGRNAVIGKRSFRERYVEGVASFNHRPTPTVVEYEVCEMGVHATSLTTQDGDRFRRERLEGVYIPADSPIGELLVRG